MPPTKSERAALRTQGLGSGSAQRGSSWVTKVPRALCSFRVFQPQIINRVLLCGKQNSGRQESPPQLQDRPTLLRPLPSAPPLTLTPPPSLRPSPLLSSSHPTPRTPFSSLHSYFSRRRRQAGALRRRSEVLHSLALLGTAVR